MQDAISNRPIPIPLQRKELFLTTMHHYRAQILTAILHIQGTVSTCTVSIPPMCIFLAHGCASKCSSAPVGIDLMGITLEDPWRHGRCAAQRQDPRLSARAAA